MKDTKKALFALVAVAITIGYLWQTNRVVTPKAATWNNVLTEARHGGYQIISTDEFHCSNIPIWAKPLSSLINQSTSKLFNEV